MTPEDNENLSVEEILSSIRSILLEGNTSSSKQDDSDVSAEDNLDTAEFKEKDEGDEIFDLSEEMIVKPIPVSVMAEEPAPQPEPQPQPQPEKVAEKVPEKTSNNEDVSEELLRNFADIFAEKTLHEIDLGRPDMSREVNAWLNENLKPIAEKVIKEEIDKLRSFRN